jgi:hypothetical protein
MRLKKLIWSRNTELPRRGVGIAALGFILEKVESF